MAHDLVETGGDDAAIGRKQAEAAAERHLPGDHDQQPAPRSPRSPISGAARATAGGRSSGGPEHRHRRQHARPDAAIDGRRGAPEDRQDDDQRFAQQQEQPGDVAGLRSRCANRTAISENSRRLRSRAPPRSRAAARGRRPHACRRRARRRPRIAAIADRRRVFMLAHPATRTLRGNSCRTRRRAVRA